MSTIWTPGGERPVGNQSEPESTPSTAETQSTQGLEPEGRIPSPEEMEQLEELQRQLSETPAAVVIANHCFGLFELAALHLSLPVPQLAESKLAIDALGAITDSLEGRLGEGEPQLREGLAQLRLAYVQISQALEAEAETDAEG